MTTTEECAQQFEKETGQDSQFWGEGPGWSDAFVEWLLLHYNKEYEAHAQAEEKNKELQFENERQAERIKDLEQMI